MSDKPMEGTAAAAVGAHSKDAMVGSNPAGGESLGDTANKMSAEAKEALGKAGNSAASMARSAGESLSRAGGQAYRQGAQASEAVGGMVRADPLPALLVAGAVGFALGLLIGRR